MRKTLTTRGRLFGAAALGLAGWTAVGSSFSLAQTAAAWPTFHAGSTRSGVTNVNGPTGPQFANRWSLPKAVESSPVIDSSGTAYVGDDDGNVYALSPSNPTTYKWKFTTGDAVIGTPTLTNDGSTLLVASSDGVVYALNTSDGTKKWSQAIGGNLKGSPLLSSDGSLAYVPLPYGSFKTLNVSNGSVVQTTQINGAISGSLAASPDGGTLYVATNNAYMYGVSAPNSNNNGQLSPFYLDGEAFGTPSVDGNGNIYVTTNQGSLDKFTPANSQPQWIFNTPGRQPSASTPALFNGIAYFGSGDNNLYAINVSNGQQVWQAHTGGQVVSSPAVASGNSIVYAGSEDGNVYALDAATGALRWNRSLGSAVDSSPALATDGSLWVASTAGSVFRFHAVTIPGVPSTTPAAATSTPAPTATNGPTATTGPTATPTSTSTGTAGPAFTLKSRVKVGTKQIIKVTTTPGATIRFRVNYPNGDHQSHRAKANSRGIATYSYTQGASKIKHNRLYATVTARNAANATTTKQYKILFGRIDLSLEPRTQAIGKIVGIWIHAGARQAVSSFLFFPNGRLIKMTGRTGPKGWAHLSYRVARGMTRGSNHKVIVLARLYNQPNVSTKSTFKIK